MTRQARRPTLNDVYLANDDDGETACAVCGEEIEEGERVVHCPAGFGPPGALVLEHLWCAVGGNEIDLTGTCVEAVRRDR